jgi:peroxiredoxin
MYKTILLYFFLFLPPLSIWGQNDSLKSQLAREKATKFYRSLVTPDSTVVGFSVTYQDDTDFYLLKVTSKGSYADSLKKDLLPTNLRDTLFNIRQRLKLKYYIRDSIRDSTLKAMLGQPIPDFDARDTMGLVHRPANYRGRVLLLHFFNFWDSSFENEIPVLNNLIEKYHNQGLEILSFMDIGMADTERRWLKEKPINHPLITDARVFMKKFIPVDKQVPYVVLVDKMGNFRYCYLKNVINHDKRKMPNGEKQKFITFDEWEAKIVELLGESF